MVEGGESVGLTVVVASG